MYIEYNNNIIFLQGLVRFFGVLTVEPWCSAPLARNLVRTVTAGQEYCIPAPTYHHQCSACNETIKWPAPPVLCVRRGCASARCQPDKHRAHCCLSLESVERAQGTPPHVAMAPSSLALGWLRGAPGRRATGPEDVRHLGREMATQCAARGDHPLRQQRRGQPRLHSVETAACP